MSKTTGAQLLRERTEVGLRDHSGDCCSLRMGVQSQASSRRSAPAPDTFPDTSASVRASRESHCRRTLKRAKRRDRRLDAVGGARALLSTNVWKTWLTRMGLLRGVDSQVQSFRYKIR
eukprot:scaffold3614_cov179-Pinguiococcus_pyrenoidosus.AAC.1